jgi:hypothetical protein
MTKIKPNTYLKMQTSIPRTFLVAGLCLTGLCISATAQPSFNGISQEEALRQANELLRQHGIDPTGSDDAAEDSHTTEDSNDSATTQTAPNLPQPAENRPAFQPLSLEDIRGDADVWPAKVLILEELHFHGGLTLTPGNVVDFAGFHDAENVLIRYRDNNFFIPANFTDVIERSNRIASGHAKAEGYRGRILEQLDSILVTLSGEEMRRTSSDVLAGADLFLFYISSDACGWCRQFTPKLVKAMQQVERNFPGRIKLIHASVDRNLAEFQTQYTKSGAQAGIPPTDRRWFLDVYSALHPNVTQIPQPSLMLLNANGRLIDSAARDNRNTVAIESLLERLAQHAANASTLRPQWMQLTAPLARNRGGQSGQ